MKRFLQLLSFFVVLFTLCHGYVLPQSKKSTIAVLDFIPISQISTEETALLTEKFRHALIKLDKFIVVERSKMESILKEQEFSMTDQCNTNECAVQIGQLLAAEKIITGNIGKIGGTYSITIRLIDVSTGQSENSVDYEHKGVSDELLDVFRRLAGELVNPSSSKSEDKTVTFIGMLSMNDVDIIYAALNQVKDVKEIQELSIQKERRKYRIVYEGKSISILRQHLTGTLKKNDFKLTLTEQTDNSLEFMISKDQTTAPSFPLKLFAVTGIASMGAGAYSFIAAKSSYDKFKKATTSADALKYKDRTKTYDKYTLYGAAGFAGSLACFWIYYQIYKTTLPEPVSLYIEPNGAKSVCVGFSASF